MAVLTAELITDPAIASPPWLEELPDGWRGQRTYAVNTHDEANAIDFAASARPLRSSPV